MLNGKYRGVLDMSLACYKFTFKVLKL